MSIACWFRGHTLTKWVEALYVPGNVRGCIRRGCYYREYSNGRD